jgi:hypothetical protein
MSSLEIGMTLVLVLALGFYSLLKYQEHTKKTHH